jgi:predicted secreted protein
MTYTQPSYLSLTIRIILFLQITMTPAAVFCGQVTLAWTKNTEPDIAGYRIFCREQNSSYNYSRPDWEGSGTSCVIRDLDDNKVYYTIVRAYNTSNIESLNSNEVSFQTTSPEPVPDEPSPPEPIPDEPTPPEPTSPEPVPDEPIPTEPSPSEPSTPDSGLSGSSSSSCPNSSFLKENYFYKSTLEGQTVIIDDINNLETDYDIDRYHWEQLTGRPVALSDSSAATPTFTAPYVDEDGTELRFVVEVRTADNRCDTAEISIVVSPYTEASLVEMLTPSNYSISRLEVGDAYYLDRTYTLTSVPSELSTGLEAWIRTRNNDKKNTSDSFLKLVINLDSTVYIGYDSRATSIPNWLSTNFEPTDMAIGNSESMGHFNVYKQILPADTISVGGNLARGAMGVSSNYIIVVQPNANDLNESIQPNDNRDQAASCQTSPFLSENSFYKSVIEGETVTLDDINNLKTDYDIVEYHWEQLSGEPVTLSDSSAAVPTFTAPFVDENGTELILTVEVTTAENLCDTVEFVIDIEDESARNFTESSGTKDSGSCFISINTGSVLGSFSGKAFLFYNILILLLAILSLYLMYSLNKKFRERSENSF